ncbi:acyltransferase family protein [Acinetobacter shaoyimingii]|uniref:Acyltransferase n=1 Tax=Acinetobacter shaoyimingii TaxID=2715164 RepID=A0A6G8RZF5_9GAMM|nr:acyltransferase family protein [Acinetobacter shaoyimingii]QIO07245.1 acyltransferase [Acinetobacter shaoyimingii]
MRFRTDINGLRAYAVLAVIVFHFNRQWLPGGFAGVDVFFVISGYLMTSIIFRGFEENKFSIRKFLSARVKRIIPALLFLVTILMIFGYFFLGPIAYSSLAKHSGSSLLFFSNIVYWNESGYFDALAREKFLLHTWSLSVEWQFYVIYPIVLFILFKYFNKEIVKKIIVISAVLAVIFSIYASQRWSIASYFLLSTRGWEMLLGGIAFLYSFELKKQSLKIFLEILGITFLFVSFFIFTENTIWPGYAALLPTLGAFILIQANNQKSIFTNNIVFQKLGLWSYSLYLWHWSILSISNYFSYKINFFTFCLVTLVCGIVSYYFIEKRQFSPRSIIYSVVVVLFIILIIYKSNGASFRVDSKFKLTQQQFRNQYEGHLNRPNNVEVTYFNSSEKDFEYILLGNSHARHFFSYINDDHLKLAEITLDGCLSTKNFFATYDQERCSKMYDLAMSFIKNHPHKKVIISYQFPHVAINRTTKSLDHEFIDAFFNQELDDMVSSILNSNATVYLIGRTQGTEKSLYACLGEKQLMLPKKLMAPCKVQEPFKIIEDNEKLKHYVQHKQSNQVRYIDPNAVLCEKAQCRTLNQDREPIYTDTSHLSIYGANIVGRYIFDEIEKNEGSAKN